MNDVMKHGDDKALLHEAKRLLSRVHGMPWVAMDVDKALADKVEGPVLRELLVMLPDIVDALDNAVNGPHIPECSECGETISGVLCGDCHAEDANYKGAQIEDEGGGL